MVSPREPVVSPREPMVLLGGSLCLPEAMVQGCGSNGIVRASGVNRAWVGFLYSVMIQDLLLGFSEVNRAWLVSSNDGQKSVVGAAFRDA